MVLTIMLKSSMTQLWTSENFTIEAWIWLDNNTTNPVRSGGTMYAGWVILDGEGDAGMDSCSVLRQRYRLELAIPLGQD